VPSLTGLGSSSSGLRRTYVLGYCLSPLRGWFLFLRLAHGLRRGLHSFAALRLGLVGTFCFAHLAARRSSGAEAWFVFYALRGAEAAALPRYSDGFRHDTGEVKNNVKVKNGASGVRGSHLSQKARKVGHPLLFLVQEVKKRDVARGLKPGSCFALYAALKRPLFHGTPRLPGRHGGGQGQHQGQERCFRSPWFPTLSQSTRKDGAPSFISCAGSQKTRHSSGAEARFVFYAFTRR